MRVADRPLTGYSRLGRANDDSDSGSVSGASFAHLAAVPRAGPLAAALQDGLIKLFDDISPSLFICRRLLRAHLHVFLRHAFLRRSARWLQLLRSRASFLSALFAPHPPPLPFAPFSFFSASCLPPTLSLSRSFVFFTVACVARYLLSLFPFSVLFFFQSRCSRCSRCRSRYTPFSLRLPFPFPLMAIRCLPRSVILRASRVFFFFSHQPSFIKLSRPRRPCSRPAGEADLTPSFHKKSLKKFLAVRGLT